MSVAQAQELYDILLKVDALMNGVTVQSDKLQRDLPQLTASVITIQQSLRLMWRLTALLNRMGLPDEVAAAIQKITAITRAAMMAYYALNLIEKGTVYGQIAGLIGVAAVAVSSMTIMEGY